MFCAGEHEHSEGEKYANMRCCYVKIEDRSYDENIGQMWGKSFEFRPLELHI